MALHYDNAIQAASRVVNTVLGAPCLYRKQSGDVCKDVHVVFNKNKPVTNDFGVLAGYRVEASILKDEIAKVSVNDEIVDSKGDTWRITMLMMETTAKWYVDVTRI